MEWYRECSWPIHSPRLPRNRVDRAHGFVLHAERYSRAVTLSGNWNAGITSDKTDGCPFSSKSHTDLVARRVKEVILFPSNLLLYLRSYFKKFPESLKCNPNRYSSVAVSRLYWWLFLICFVLCFPMNGLKVFPHSRATVALLALLFSAAASAASSMEIASDNFFPLITVFCNGRRGFHYCCFRVLVTLSLAVVALLRTTSRC